MSKSNDKDKLLSSRSSREQPRRRVVTMERSAFSLVAEGFKKLTGFIDRPARKPYSYSRSFAPKTIFDYETLMAGIETPKDVIAVAEFFDEPVTTSYHGPEYGFSVPENDDIVGHRRLNINKALSGAVVSETKKTGFTLIKRHREKRDSEDETDGDGFDSDDGAVSKLFNNAKRHGIGLSVLTNVFQLGNSKGSMAVNRRNRRPYFTYWCTFIQIVIYIVSLVTFGIAPLGMGTTTVTGEVLTSKLVYEQVKYQVKDNIWVGPTQEDLIHMGAKYTPCMRNDENVIKFVKMDRSMENNTACCVRDDGYGCLQTLEENCSKRVSRWLKWTKLEPGVDGRLSGSVCGQDPNYCINPSSSGQFVWQDDISTWPVCKEMAQPSQGVAYHHLTCEIVGRPCCYGIQGECMITTREECTFRKGYFHIEATLCSQMNCMDDICGMFSFIDPTIPDQFYRLITASFIHSGIIHIVITFVFQMVFMRDIEKIVGWWRVAINYILSGLAGTLCSAIFLPHNVEAGPSGAQFGILGAVYVEILQWTGEDNRLRTFSILTLFLIILLCFGLLPILDNYAHAAGLVVGILVSISLRPLPRHENEKLHFKLSYILAFIICSILCAGFIAGLFVLFYYYPIYSCQYCSYFNCIPFTETFCEGMNVNIQR